MNPHLEYWHVYTDENGISRQEKALLKNFVEKSVGGDADPQWMNLLQQSGKRILLMDLPANWVGEWHENPAPQWIIPLSGRWFVETMDGQRVEMGPGDLSFGADQGTNEGKGHRSGSLDGKPCQMMVIQLDEKWNGVLPGKLESK